MVENLVALEGSADATPVLTVVPGTLAAVLDTLDAAQRNWVTGSGFAGKPGQVARVPQPDGSAAQVLVGVDADDPLWALAHAAGSLPAGLYTLQADGAVADTQLAALGWALAAYHYDRFVSRPAPQARLVLPADDCAAVLALAHATAQVRDLVNTPAGDLGPEELAQAVVSLGEQHGAQVRQWVGDELLDAGFPLVHAVGRAASRAPRMVELTWGAADAPHLVLVGKGVCFDTGGLDMKAADGMRLMKKDMGGAAHVIALAGLVMQAGLPVRLTLLVPAVENAVAGDALRPGDVVRTTSGLTVEIHNTDAEGRLVLGDALTYAGNQKPDLMIDMATLTGAARIALGPDLPALFANRDADAQAVLQAGCDVQDPLWRMPLWRPYRRLLKSHVADFTNSGTSRHAGAVVAAIYLERFVPDDVSWLHVDTFAWNDTAQPGRPVGGEAMGLRALFAFLQQRYGHAA